MIDPKTYSSLLQVSAQETAPSAAEIAKLERRQLSFILHSWNQFRMQEALAVMEERRLAARHKVLAELGRFDRTH
ncbi:MAG TPA: hypothetical protein VKV77_08465 [Methylovirgula sp.]|nr:hypothetical protein [Methylovirgula sp.]